MYVQMTLPGLHRPISSLVSAYGRLHSAAPDGRMTGRSGQAHAPASPSAPQESARVSMMNATCGLSFTGSSASAALTQSLVNKLRAKTALLGSTLYALTWKERVTPLGRSIPALRASVRRTSDKDCTGWPTPNASNGKGAYQDVKKNLARAAAGH